MFIPIDINNLDDGFGKPIAELTAILGTLSEDTRKRIDDRVEYHVDKTLMALGFPTTGYQMLQIVTTISEVVVADLVSEGYLEVTDKGFVKLEDSEPDQGELGLS